MTDETTQLLNLLPDSASRDLAFAEALNDIVCSSRSADDVANGLSVFSERLDSEGAPDLAAAWMLFVAEQLRAAA